MREAARRRHETGEAENQLAAPEVASFRPLDGRLRESRTAMASRFALDRRAMRPFAADAWMPPPILVRPASSGSGRSVQKNTKASHPGASFVRAVSECRPYHR
jgi:hypothetical protein